MSSFLALTDSLHLNSLFNMYNNSERLTWNPLFFWEAYLRIAWLRDVMLENDFMHNNANLNKQIKKFQKKRFNFFLVIHA